MKPAAPLALRTSGHLLLGVVRIHDGKQQSLMHDCSHALVQIKLAFRPGNVDLPAKGSTNLAAITMTETFADFDMEMEEPLAGNGDMAEANMTMNIGTAEEITMPEANISTIEVRPTKEQPARACRPTPRPYPGTCLARAREHRQAGRLGVGHTRGTPHALAISWPHQDAR